MGSSARIDPSVRLIFWGVRGSMVRPEPSFQRFGGNTPCLELRLDRRRSLIFDAGLGLRWQANEMLDRQTQDNEVHILLSHCHWDHIQGIPFSPLMYLPTNRVTVHGVGYPHRPLLTLLSEQLRPEFCPVPNFFQDGIGAQVEVRQLDTESGFDLMGLRVYWSLLSRGSAGQYVVGYRVEGPWGAMAYLTDWVPVVEGPALDLVRGCKVLVHDAFWLPEEEDPKSGHSSYRQALELARAGAVEQLFCTHHHPGRDDRQLEKLDRQLQAVSAVRAQFAYEGLEVDLTN